MYGGGWRILGAAALLVLSSIAAAGWTLVDIGTLGGPGSYGAAVSNSGIVAGCADTASGAPHAFTWSNGEMRDLGEPGSGPSCALAVNNEGLVAGRSATGELVVWGPAGVTRLGVQGDVGAIDAFGVVVGAYREGTGTVAFKYANGAITPLANLPAGSYSAATAINARGQIVGSANGRAAMFESGTVRDLGTLGGNGSSARGINDTGNVVGMAADDHGQPLPFLFDGTMHALPGPSYSSALAINNRGQVVGSAEGTYGYLLENGQYTRLDTLPSVAAKGWRRLEPTGINDRGWIVGTATSASGDLRAFLLVPMSERAPVAKVARLGRGPQ